MFKVSVLAGFAAAVALSAPAQAEPDIKVVGSSTVFPFSEVVVGAYEAQTGKDVKLESTGTGGGFKKFCAGEGAAHPTITGASRAIKAKEFDLCASNGVNNIVELRIGHDGIVVASYKTDYAYDFTLETIYLALAEKIVIDGGVVDNPYSNWDQIQARLPNRPITVYGPPQSSGTRDSVETLALKAACKKRPGYDTLTSDQRSSVCKTVRPEPHYVEMTEDDEDTVRALTADKGGFGIFGYSFALNNPDIVSGHPIDGVDASFESIASGEYPLSRPLYVYAKRASLAEGSPEKELLELYLSDEMMGASGKLAKIGLVPMTEAELLEARTRLSTLKTIGRP